MHQKNWLILTLTFLLFTFNFSTISAEEEVKENKEKQQPLMYFQVVPNILTFYQSNSKKFGYIVVQVQVVIRGQEHYDLVDANLPLIQDALIDFFNRQNKETVEDLTKREQLRLEAKDRISEVLKEELDTEIVENLLFTQYVFQ